MNLAEAVGRVRYELYKAEGFSDDDIYVPIPPPGTREHARYLDFRAELAEKRVPELTREFRAALAHSLGVFARTVPNNPPSPFTAPVVDFIPNIGRLIEDIAEPFFRADKRLFRQLRARIAANTERLDKVPPAKLAARLPPTELVRAYFGGTPLERLFAAEIFMPFPQEKRYEGQWILAHPGAGKTQALAYLIQQDLRLVAAGEASIVIMDSQGNTPGGEDKPPTLLHTVSHLRMFAPGGALYGRLTYVDAADASPIPLNIFDLRFPGAPDVRFAATKELLEFIFTALVGEPFSGPMERLFAKALRLMLSIPGARLADFRRLLHADGARHFAKQIAALDDDTRDFFEHQFAQSSIQVTKTAVLSRLEGLDSYPLFERLVSHRKTELSLFDEMEAGRVIIIDTNAGALHGGTSLMGRFFLALIAAAGKMRIGVEERRKTPTFVYIDELADYCARNANQIDEIIATCRKQNIGICAANQWMSQIPDPSVRTALRSSAIRFANPEPEDAYTMATTMGETAAKFLTNRERGSFAAHIRGMPRAVSIKVPFPNLSAEPSMGCEEYRRVRDEIRRHYAPPSPQSTEFPAKAARPAPPTPEPPAKGSPPDDPDRPQDWRG